MKNPFKKFIKYTIDFVDFDQDTEFYTYNVYLRLWHFSWPVYSFEDKTADVCRTECRKYIDSITNGNV